MICPYCGCTNNDSAKFCKKCGKSLSPANSNEESSDSQYQHTLNESSGKSSKNLIIICITVIICTALIVGSVLFISYSDNGTNDNSNVNSSANVVSDSVNQSSDNNKVNTDNKKTTTTQEASTPNTISYVDWVEFYLDGNPNTGVDATIYVGPEYSSEDVEVGVRYSRNGNYFEFEGYNWYTVGSDGTIFVRTYAPVNKYPDKCEISLTHNGNTLSLTCPMKKHKGTQRVNL